jgi:hypothetical protein
MCTGFFPPGGGGGGSTGGGKGFAPGRGGFWLAPGGDNRNVNEIFTRGGKKALFKGKNVKMCHITLIVM